MRVVRGLCLRSLKLRNDHDGTFFTPLRELRGSLSSERAM